jgi:hypothetical protein
MAFAERSPARHSRSSRNPFHAGEPFRGLHGSQICYGLPVCSPPCTDPTSFPAVGDFYVQASDGSVTLPAAGYDYSSVWTPLLAGLAPAGMAASLAARSPRFRRGPFVRDVVFDPGRTTMPRVAASLVLRSTLHTVSAPAKNPFRGSFSHPTRSLCTLRSGRYRPKRNTYYQADRYSLPGPVFHRLDHASLAWRT